jgi:hypothetical protein
MDGASFLPLLRGEDVAWRKSTFHHAPMEPSQSFPREFAVQTDTYKLLFFTGPDGDDLLLVDRRADPQERFNLAASPEHQEILAFLQAELRSWTDRLDPPRPWKRRLKRAFDPPSTDDR